MAHVWVESLPRSWVTRGVGVIAQTVRGSEYACTSVFCLPKKKHGLVLLLQYIIFRRFSHNCENRLLASSCLSVCPHGTTQLSCLRIFRKSVEKTEVSLKLDKNNGYFTWRPIHIYDNISVNSFRIRNISDKFVEKINTYFTRISWKLCRLRDNAIRIR
jgi:hypothetical protein